MQIKMLKWQHMNEFRAIYKCGNCGATKEGDGYDDANFHENVIPAMVCEECGQVEPSDMRGCVQMLAEYNKQMFKEGDEVRIAGRLVKMKHITGGGFLYCRTADKRDTSVTVNDENGSTTFYSDWDRLVFVPCKTYVEYSEPKGGCNV